LIHNGLLLFSSLMFFIHGSHTEKTSNLPMNILALANQSVAELWYSHLGPLIYLNFSLMFSIIVSFYSMF
jgi:hypothetical protein